MNQPREPGCPGPGCPTPAQPVGRSRRGPRALRLGAQALRQERPPRRRQLASCAAAKLHANPVGNTQRFALVGLCAPRLGFEVSVGLGFRVFILCVSPPPGGVRAPAAAAPREGPRREHLHYTLYPSSSLMTTTRGRTRPSTRPRQRRPVRRRKN